jgi:hypothetical protein
VGSKSKGEMAESWGQELLLFPLQSYSTAKEEQNQLHYRQPGQQANSKQGNLGSF